MIGGCRLSGQNGDGEVVFADARGARYSTSVAADERTAERMAAGGVRNRLDFLDLLFVCRIAAAGCGRVALSGEGKTLLAAELVRRRFFPRIARRACALLLDAGLADAAVFG